MYTSCITVLNSSTRANTTPLLLTQVAWASGFHPSAHGCCKLAAPRPEQGTLCSIKDGCVMSYVMCYGCVIKMYHSAGEQLESAYTNTTAPSSPTPPPCLQDKTLAPQWRQHMTRWRYVHALFPYLGPPAHSLCRIFWPLCAVMIISLLKLLLREGQRRETGPGGTFNTILSKLDYSNVT